MAVIEEKRKFRGALRKAREQLRDYEEEERRHRAAGDDKKAEIARDVAAKLRAGLGKYKAYRTPAGPSRLSKIGSGFKKVGGVLKKGAAGGWAATKAVGRAPGRLQGAVGGGKPPRKIAGWIFVALSLLLYYFIDWQFGYNGIDIGLFFQMGAIDWIFKSGVLTILLVVIIIQLLVFKRLSGSSLFLGGIFALMFVLAKYSVGALYHLIFILIMWWVLIKPVKEDIDSAYNTLAILILIDFVGFSLLGKLFEFTSVFQGTVALSYMIFPIYTLYLLYYLEAYGDSRIATAALCIIMIIYVMGFVTNSSQYATFTAQLKESPKVEEAKGFWGTALFNTYNFFAIMTDPLVCSLSSPTNHESCMLERQYARLCRDKKIGTEEYDECIAQKKGLNIAGSVDESIKEFTKIEFEKPSDFPKVVQKEFPADIPMQINIESPKKPITVELSCKFKLGREEIEGGKAEPEKIEEITGTKKQTVFCELAEGEEYEGGRTYTVIYEAAIRGIETESTLTRLFVGKELKEAEKGPLMSLHGLEAVESSKSPDEFAAFSFGIGTPATDPFIGSNPKQPLIGNIENKADGQILSVDDIEVSLIDGVASTQKCTERAFNQQGNVLKLDPEMKDRLVDLKLKKDEKLFLLGCNLDVYQNLAETEEYVKRSFTSKITYSYAIKREDRFTTTQTIEIS
jgi:hypothetical protein